MLLIVVALLLAVAVTIFVIRFYKRDKDIKIRIGRRGSSVLVAEIDFNDNFELAENILRTLNDSNNYCVYFVCSGAPDLVAKKNILEKEYYIERFPENRANNLKLNRVFKDISFFFLNKGVEDDGKILLTHDLIVNSAQIPDREILMESGFIFTIIQPSNLIIIIGVRGEFEKLIFHLVEDNFSKGNKIILSKM